MKEQLFSQRLKIRISFASLSENMTFEYCLTQPKSMLEWKLLAKLDKNPEIVCLFDYRQSSHTLIREYFMNIMNFNKVNVYNKCYCL